MKIKFNLLTFSIICFFIFTNISFAAEELEIKSPQLIVRFDNQFRMTIIALDFSGKSIIEPSESVQIGIQIDSLMITEFNVQPDKSTQTVVDHDEFGKSQKAVIYGIYEKNGLKIERETDVLLPAKYPTVILVKTKFRNLGNIKIHIDKVFSQRILLNRKLAEPGQKPYDFASFQGGINKWGSDYTVIKLSPGFYQENFMGTHDIDNGSWIYQVSGGMPFIDVWGKTMGVALMHIQKKPAWVSLPVKVNKNGSTEIAITEQPKEDIGMKEWLQPGEYYETVLTALIVHKLDYYDPLHIYGNLLRDRGVNIRKTSSKIDYDAYWMSWAFRMGVTQNDILKTLPSLKAIGITRANLDAGWFDNQGDWNPSKEPGKFPNGDADMINFVKEVKSKGFKTAVWWYPIAVDPKSKFAEENKDLLVQAKDGSYTKSESGFYRLCPAYEPALKRIDTLVKRMIEKWGFDGFYLDKIGLAGVAPCYNPKHHHKYPLESYESMPKLFKRIEEDVKKYTHKENFLEVCICSTPHSPYNMPYYGNSSASDPINPKQMRRRVKAEKAIHGPTYAVGDSYELPADEYSLTGNQEAFESALGTGAKMTAQYADLDSTELIKWKKWFDMYGNLGLSSGEYKNYYDVVFDKPEGHTILKDGNIYYGFFAHSWGKGSKIELRGLDKNKKYKVIDYAHNRIIGTIDGSDPYLNYGFKESLLLKVTPIE